MCAQLKVSSPARKVLSDTLYSRAIRGASVLYSTPTGCAVQYRGFHASARVQFHLPTVVLVAHTVRTGLSLCWVVYSVIDPSFLGQARANAPTVYQRWEDWLAVQLITAPSIILSSLKELPKNYYYCCWCSSYQHIHTHPTEFGML